MTKTLIFSLIVFILVVGIIDTVYADSLLNKYDFNKQNAKDWREKSKNYDYGSNLWTINIFLDDEARDYTKDFWLPIEPWEYMVCSQGLSTQLVDTEKAYAVGGGIYANMDAISVAAYRRVARLNDSFLYEVTWYIQPSGERGFMYTVDAIGHGETKSIQTKKGAGQRLGDSGYVAFYSSINYTEIILTYLDEEHPYPIIEVKDANRQ
jgi:hypothetical protein